MAAESTKLIAPEADSNQLVHPTIDLRAYEQAKFELTDILRVRASHLSRGTDPLYERFRELFGRLAEDRFNLIVAGRFSRGKTSLMNAILATDRLPTGIVPLTSVITSVRYGSREQVQIEWNHGRTPLEIGLNQLADYVTERGNPGNTRGIRQANIELPAEILRRGFHFVDTPGLGSAIRENTRTTEAFLPEADALILVSGYESPLSAEELRILEAIAHTSIRAFFVLNKQDTVSASQRLEAQNYVTQQLKSIFHTDDAPPVFSTSALEGLAGKLTNDIDKLSKSGLPQLEVALVRFLLHNKNRNFLLRMCDRAMSLMDAGDAHPAVAHLKTRIETLRAQLSTGHADQNRPREAVPAVMADPGASAQIRPCAICRQIDDAFFEFLCSYQSALLRDPKAQATFLAEGGFCATHWWQYASMAASRDICVAVTPLLKHVSHELRVRDAASIDTLRSRYVTFRGGGPNCRMCAIQKNIELEAAHKISAHASTHTKDLSTAASAICLPHALRIATALSDPSVARVLLANQARMAERLAEDMQRYALKRDGLRRALVSDEEEVAAAMAIRHIAGGRSLIR
jgi:GTP-binding protein EngB required for normal cell division